jgi:hypothetical protein
MLKSQTPCERADRPVDDTNGNREDIGGEVCTWGGATLTVSVEGEVCAMAGETKANANATFDLVWKICHMIINWQRFSHNITYSTVYSIHTC